MATEDYKGYVYHIQDPENVGSNEHGYIGVTVEHRGVYERFKEHKRGPRHMRSLIKKNNVDYEKHVRTLFYGPLSECYQLEAQLRPHQKMGWNIASGGKGYNYKSDIEDLSLFRSKMQKERMANNELRSIQGKTFKEKYYNDPEMQKLRSQRAREHMNIPGKREVCLNAMHKKIKCPHCDFENNAGNVAIHIRKKHI
jgi:hypothetical protein